MTRLSHGYETSQSWTECAKRQSLRVAVCHGIGKAGDFKHEFALQRSAGRSALWLCLAAAARALLNTEAAKVGLPRGVRLLLYLHDQEQVVWVVSSPWLAPSSPITFDRHAERAQRAQMYSETMESNLHSPPASAMPTILDQMMQQVILNP